MLVDEFSGLKVLVTGGASGLGLATARRLRDAGARVAVLDMNPPDEAENLLFVAADIGEHEQVDRAIATVASEFGGLDILVNNAGVGAQGKVEDNSDDEWHRVLNINVLGTVRVTRAALPMLRQSVSASVVNVCSVVSLVGILNRALYTAAKGAITSLTTQMAADYLSEGIRFNAVHPGTADTAWVQRLLESADDPVLERTHLEARQPHGRLVAPSEIADAVAYLASPRALSTTGTSLIVDGGLAGLRLPSAATS